MCYWRAALASFVGSWIIKTLVEDGYSVNTTITYHTEKKDPLGYLQINMVHVDDLARAQIFLLEHLNPKGRCNCSTCLANIEELLEILSIKYGKFQLPTLVSVKQSSGMKFPSLSSKKLTDAGFEFKYGLEEMFVDVVYV